MVLLCKSSIVIMLNKNQVESIPFCHIIQPIYGLQKNQAIRMFYLKYHTENSQGMWLLVILHLFTQQTLILPNREEPMEWLISTKSLLNAHVAYNTRYKAFICTLCHAAVPLKELTGHLMAKVQHVVFDAPGYFPHSGPPHIWGRKIVHHLTPPIPYRSFGSFVCAEMRKHGINIDKSDEEKNIVCPNPVQDSPILGLAVYSHGYICITCGFAHLSQEKLQSCKCKDPKIRKPIPTPVQTIGRGKAIEYFPLPGYKLPLLSNEDQVVDNIEDTPATHLHKHKKAIAAKLPQSEDSSQDDFRNIHPCFVSLSIHDFLRGYNKEDTRKIYLTMEKEYCDLSPSLQHLYTLVGRVFNEDCNLCDPSTRSPSNSIIAQHIAKFSLGYVKYNLNKQWVLIFP